MKKQILLAMLLTVANYHTFNAMDNKHISDFVSNVYEDSLLSESSDSITDDECFSDNENYESVCNGKNCSIMSEEDKKRMDNFFYALEKNYETYFKILDLKGQAYKQIELIYSLSNNPDVTKYFTFINNLSNLYKNIVDIQLKQVNVLKECIPNHDDIIESAKEQLKEDQKHQENINRLLNITKHIMQQPQEQQIEHENMIEFIQKIMQSDSVINHCESDDIECKGIIDLPTKPYDTLELLSLESSSDDEN